MSACSVSSLQGKRWLGMMLNIVLEPRMVTGSH
jgi:hypothetical protein